MISSIEDFKRKYGSRTPTMLLDMLYSEHKINKEGQIATALKEMFTDLEHALEKVDTASGLVRSSLRAV